MSDERVRDLEERLVMMGRLMSMLLEFVTKEASEALFAVKALRQALVAKDVVSEDDLEAAARRRFRQGESVMFQLDPEIHEVLLKIQQLLHEERGQS
jgi:hypothetical protein